MMYPPSLPQDVRDRAFVAKSGEPGILPTDTGAFLDACLVDGVDVLGWELWVIRHRLSLRRKWSLRRWWNREPPNEPVAASWSGAIPLADVGGVNFVGGEGDAEEVRQQLADFDIEASVKPKWLPLVRVNFFLAD